MFLVTPNPLVFKQLELQLINHLQGTNVLRKIQSTDINSLKVTPNLGFIKANTLLSVLVTSIKKISFSEKLRITYAFISRPPVNFEVSWAEVAIQQSFKHQIITVQREQLQLDQTDQNEPQKCKTDSMHMSNNSKDARRTLSLDLIELKSLPSITQNLDEQVSPHKSKRYSPKVHHSRSQGKFYIDPQQVEQLRYLLSQAQKKYNLQRISNTRIRQQLQISQQKLKEVTEQRLHIKINKSIGIICNEYHTSFSYLLIFALAFFVCGYCMASI